MLTYCIIFFISLGSIMIVCDLIYFVIIEKERREIERALECTETRFRS